VKNVTVSLDDDTYRKAKRRAAESDRSLSSVVREALQTYGAPESDFDRLARRRRELVAELDILHPKFAADRFLTREELYDADRIRAERRAAWR
jgi:predicted transcriptional regulator